MSKRRWTIVVVPQGSSASRIIEVSQTALKLVITTAVSVAVVLLLLGYATMSRTADLARAEQLEQENARLAAAPGQIDGRLSQLQDTLAVLEERDNRIRVMANLDPIAPSVRDAGIGGPASVPAAGSRTDGSVLTKRSGEIRVDLNALIRRANLLATSVKVAADSLSEHADRLAALPSIMPTQGWLSSNFSSLRLHPILNVARPHPGIDITAPRGTPILAPGAGKVLTAGWSSGYGQTVTIDHGYGIVTKFAHASKILVRPGQRVERGQKIALVGSTGLSVAPHLHYEVHVNGRPVDPRRYVLPDGIQ